MNNTFISIMLGMVNGACIIAAGTRLDNAPVRFTVLNVILSVAQAIARGYAAN